MSVQSETSQSTLKVFALAKAHPMSWRAPEVKSQVVTPHAYQAARRGLKELFTVAHATVIRIRELCATGRIPDREEAEGLFDDLVLQQHAKIRETLYRLRTMPVVKYSNISRSAAARLSRSRS